MPSIINSDDGVVSGTSGLKTTGGNDGLLNLQSNGSTIVAVTGSGISVTGTVAQTGVSTFAAGTASAPAITFTGDTNTGIYSPGADRIGFAEGGTQVGEFDASGNFLFNSGYGSVAIAYGCRAWVNFDGTGTVAIRQSGNVSSITDNGTGDYTVNMTNALTDADYAVSGTCSISSIGGFAVIFTREDLTARTSSLFRVRVSDAASAARDSAQVNLAVSR
jgi:uncharacterized protein (AIM24 family)